MKPGTVLADELHDTLATLAQAVAGDIVPDEEEDVPAVTPREMDDLARRLAAFSGPVRDAAG